MSAAAPGFQIEIITVASRLWKIDIAVALFAATARLPIRATVLADKSDPRRRMANIASDSGRLRLRAT